MYKSEFLFRKRFNISDFFCLYFVFVFLYIFSLCLFLTPSLDKKNYAHLFMYFHPIAFFTPSIVLFIYTVFPTISETLL